MGIENGFFFDETKLLRHEQQEEQAVNLARELSYACDRLRRYADTDDYSLCSKIGNTAEEIYRYCKGMENAIEETRITLKVTSASIEQIIEDSNYSAWLKNIDPDADLAGFQK